MQSRILRSADLAEMALGEVRSELAHVVRVASLGALTASIAHEVNQPLVGHPHQCQHLLADAGRRARPTLKERVKPRGARFAMATAHPM